MQTYAVQDSDLIITSGEREGEKKYILKIRDLPTEERPREKLQKLGAKSLSIAELLAVVLSTGSKKEEVLVMAKRIAKEYGEDAIVHEIHPEKLSEHFAIPLGKALQIVAVGELGRRFYEKKGYGLVAIRTAEDVFNYVHDLRTLPKEHLRGLYLNAHYQIIHDDIISIGTINSSIIHPREVFRPAIEYGAVSIILVHNHPSGEVVPSQSDKNITEQLVTAGKIIGINIIDHVIVGRGGYTSVEVAY